VETLCPTLRDGVEVIEALHAASLIARNPAATTWLLPEHFELLNCEDESCCYDARRMTVDCAAASPEDIAKFHERLSRPPPSIEELKKQVPKAYHHLIDL